ncbi:MAG: hypothetical protein UX91_C0011G0003 [Candidatus Amesbacteria bacterium GW2011_GWB1_47_19]|nr:MAG: hypothetical protein UW51_C0009G0006 [Candidatus Amesbacteria bacterium GW2011_GWA1_44_24]KKU30822.1 MAG: hypothetical protein UX46_C0011G0003 [Candidatus Amesbacteria bacterium GW2011_GWC1_46_24]KKU66520.1 MAG: hypothetical protein UX91_C0011G0003 [Candidatus Amesbacteria bacterium GW2011_GWB1_47_19]OGD06529.1 MAG: hypothetical protein A2379_00145 [Candidatus Amesbacteria bacterium RIFOXYB1_FULL_47_13]HBC72931.1 hypothetical protein [Candidatus Amesbacteria bacterium]
MHEEVLSEGQSDLLPLVVSFSGEFGLVGGTAVALQLGHRRSVDFNLATLLPLDALKIREHFVGRYIVDSVLADENREYSVVVNGIKTTFMSYPFKIEFDVEFKEEIKMPSIVTLAAMKAYALGRRAKWKDYVDLYFVFQKYSLEDVVSKAKEIFGNEFNEKLFREELAYFDDIDYTEEAEFMKGFETDSEAVKKRLSEISLIMN